MKSFADYMMEDAGFSKKKKEEPEKNKKDNNDEYDYDLKEIYNLQDFTKDSKKQMKFSYTFGSKYEIMYTSVPDVRRSFSVEFTKGFDSLTEKNEIEKCLETLCDTLGAFPSLDTWDYVHDVSAMQVNIKYKKKEAGEVIKKFFEQKKLDLGDYKIEDYDVPGYAYKVSCRLKKELRRKK
jgi:hypothetical protein